MWLAANIHCSSFQLVDLHGCPNSGTRLNSGNYYLAAHHHALSTNLRLPESCPWCSANKYRERKCSGRKGLQRSLVNSIFRCSSMIHDKEEQGHIKSYWGFTFATFLLFHLDYSQSPQPGTVQLQFSIFLKKTINKRDVKKRVDNI